jgi:predicted Zn-ribbon and HTH transcriptional regulator
MTQEEADKMLREHPLATKSGLEMMVRLLLHIGAMCPKCGFGTRRTSKRWARCKKCGERVRREELPK